MPICFLTELRFISALGTNYIDWTFVNIVSCHPYVLSYFDFLQKFCIGSQLFDQIVVAIPYWCSRVVFYRNLELTTAAVMSMGITHCHLYSSDGIQNKWVKLSQHAELSGTANAIDASIPKNLVIYFFGPVVCVHCFNSRQLYFFQKFRAALSKAQAFSASWNTETVEVQCCTTVYF